MLMLDISNCKKITNDGIKYLNNIYSLVLNGCEKITNEGIDKLVGVSEIWVPASCN